MIKSMTAYGRGEVETAAQKWVVELRSLNHRFLELSLNLPRRLWALEDRFRKLIKSRVARGRVDMQLSWESIGEKALTLQVDTGLVAGVRAMLEELGWPAISPSPCGWKISSTFRTCSSPRTAIRTWSWRRPGRRCPRR